MKLNQIKNTFHLISRLCCQIQGTDIHNTDLPKDFLIDSEGEVQDVSDVIILHPLQRLVKLLIQILQVRQVCGSVRNSQLTHQNVGLCLKKKLFFEWVLESYSMERTDQFNGWLDILKFSVSRVK